MRVQFLVLAKAPVPGQVKTRLCPPCTPHQAATVAAAALADTLDTVGGMPAVRHVLVLSGPAPTPPGWRTLPQHGTGLGERLAHAYTATAIPGVASVLVGMDTPQLTPAHLAGVVAGMDTADAVLGPAADGGWWVLGLRNPSRGGVLTAVPMSTPDTARYTEAALRRHGARVARVGQLTDVDTAADARAVAAACPGSRFAAAVRANVPTAVAA
jgi:uncharacterized protein